MKPLQGVRLALWVTGLVQVVVGIAIGWDVAGGHRWWPLPEGPMGYRFVASILLAEAVVMFWFGHTLDLAAARGGAVGFALMNGGLAVQMANLHAVDGAPASLAWAVGCGLLTVGSVGLWWLGGRVPVGPRVPVPPLVRGAFLVFGITLAVAVVLLLGRAEVVFPWPLSPGSSVAYGFLFVASAAFFLDGFLRPSRANAVGQLAGFLVYDLILFAPWFAHFARAKGPFRTSLVIYVAVLCVSAALAAYYLPRWYGESRRA